MNKSYYGVIYWDEWNNSYSYYSEIGNIGYVIEKIAEEHELIIEFDKEHLNSQEPRVETTWGYGFYHIDCEKNYDNELEYAGFISIHEFVKE